MTTQLYLTPKDQGRALSLEEFEHAGGLEGYHYELIDGKLEVSPLPNMPHEELRDWLQDQLKDYVRRHPEIINHVKAPARVFVPGRRATTAPEPDIAAYHDFPLHLPLRQRRWRDFSPILVTEILSADTLDKDLVRNLDLYRQVPSIREYWIIDPRVDADRPALTVHRRRGQHWQKPIDIASGGTYTTRLLPDFLLVLDVRA
ncbi:MAG TPA: Uma2 family endonuclease [Gemmataceae bacterium]|jgi:Uma2 family endonuclease